MKNETKYEIYKKCETCGITLELTRIVESKYYFQCPECKFVVVFNNTDDENQQL